MSLRVHDVLGPSSPLRGMLEGYEDRPGQLAMAEAVEDALGSERALIVEAGTGTGKTLAYLVPALLSGRKVVISTATRALQEQIFFKDLPLVREVLGALGVSFTAAMMKGLSNYLCKRRLEERLASGEPEDRGLVQIRRWASETDSGDRAELVTLRDDDPAWLAAQSSTDTRIGADCKHYDACFVTRMKRDAEAADLVIVNHHLFCADLALRRGPRGEYAGAIPPYDAVIFDEAHQLEDVATAFFGSRVSSARVASLVRDAQRTLHARQAGEVLVRARPVFELVLEASERFFSALAARAEPGLRRVLRPRDLSPDVEAARLRLDACLEGLARTAEDPKDPAGTQIARRANDLRSAIRLIVRGLQGGEEEGEELSRVAWIESKDRSVVIGQSPVDLAPDLAEALFGGGRTVVCTSATLATPGPRGAQSFAFLRERLGVPAEARDLVVPSPFDFARRAGLYVARDLPEPQDPAFDEEAAERILALLDVTGGGAFVLTTSNRSMRALHARLRARTRLSLLLQGERPKSMLLSQFREARHAVLVATMSFWEGVDVPGHALRLVVLDKIPFAVPTDPVVAARCEAIERKRQSAFYGYSVPAAAITLKQGFGRLIRTQRDAGIVALLDRRAATKAYGRALLESLPPARRLADLDEVRSFYAEVFPDVEP